MANIHPQLSADCTTLGWFPLSYLLLMNDSNYPWFILVPKRDNIRGYVLDADQEGIRANVSDRVELGLRLNRYDFDKSFFGNNFEADITRLSINAQLGFE